MIAQENALAHEILDQIKNCVRQEPEKALTLTKAYRELVEAAAVRATIKKQP